MKKCVLIVEDDPDIADLIKLQLLDLNCDADIALIERVLDNLLGNAFNHTKSADIITINVKKQDVKKQDVKKQSTAIQIQVQDTGCGISKKDLPKVFDRFYQAENKHRKGRHAGLGLAIVKRILELHDCRIDVISKVGKGSQFRFSLLLEKL